MSNEKNGEELLTETRSPHDTYEYAIREQLKQICSEYQQPQPQQLNRNRCFTFNHGEEVSTPKRIPKQPKGPGKSARREQFSLGKLQTAWSTKSADVPKQFVLSMRQTIWTNSIAVKPSKRHNLHKICLTRTIYKSLQIKKCQLHARN